MQIRQILRKGLTLGGLLLSLVGCESLVNSSLHTQGKSAVAFDATVPHQSLTIASGDRRLVASYVAGPPSQRPLILVFHGDGEAVGDWSAAQTFLFKQGFDSLVFDYSGYGASTGHPTIKHLREDAVTAYAMATRLAGTRSQGVFVVAHSLGCNIALDAAGSFSPRAVGYALWGVTPSLREFVKRSGALPQFLLFLIPDRWNNLRDAKQMGVAAIVLHGDHDSVTTEEGAVRVAQSANPVATFLSIPDAEHNALYKSPDLRVWGSILTMALASQLSQSDRPGDSARGKTI